MVSTPETPREIKTPEELATALERKTQTGLANRIRGIMSSAESAAKETSEQQRELLRAQLTAEQKKEIKRVLHLETSAKEIVADITAADDSPAGMQKIMEGWWVGAAVVLATNSVKREVDKLEGKSGMDLLEWFGGMFEKISSTWDKFTDAIEGWIVSKFPGLAKMMGLEKKTPAVPGVPIVPWVTSPNVPAGGNESAEWIKLRASIRGVAALGKRSLSDADKNNIQAMENMEGILYQESITKLSWNAVNALVTKYANSPTGIGTELKISHYPDDQILIALKGLIGAEDIIGWVVKNTPNWKDKNLSGIISTISWEVTTMMHIWEKDIRELANWSHFKIDRDVDGKIQMWEALRSWFTRIKEQYQGCDEKMVEMLLFTTYRPMKASAIVPAREHEGSPYKEFLEKFSDFSRGMQTHLESYNPYGVQFGTLFREHPLTAHEMFGLFTLTWGDPIPENWNAFTSVYVKFKILEIATMKHREDLVSEYLAKLTWAWLSQELSPQEQKIFNIISEKSQSAFFEILKTTGNVVQGVFRANPVLTTAALAWLVATIMLFGRLKMIGWAFVIWWIIASSAAVLAKIPPKESDGTIKVGDKVYSNEEELTAAAKDELEKAVDKL